MAIPLKTVAIAEDDPGVIKLLEAVVNHLGYQCAGAARQGAEAIQLVQQAQPNLILMDVHMPEMGGIEALKEMRSMRPEQKIAMFSSGSDPSYFLEKEALKNGAVEYLLKPVELSDIDRIIHETAGTAC